MANNTGKKFGGRKKGTPNKDNELKKFLKDLANDSTEKLEQELNKLEGKAYIDAMFTLMEYVQPKLSRAEVVAEIETKESIDLSKYDIKDLKKSIESDKNPD